MLAASALKARREPSSVRKNRFNNQWITRVAAEQRHAARIPRPRSVIEVPKLVIGKRPAEKKPARGGLCAVRANWLAASTWQVLACEAVDSAPRAGPVLGCIHRIQLDRSSSDGRVDVLGLHRRLDRVARGRTVEGSAVQPAHDLRIFAACACDYFAKRVRPVALVAYVFRER